MSNDKLTPMTLSDLESIEDFDRNPEGRFLISNAVWRFFKDISEAKFNKCIEFLYDVPLDEHRSLNSIDRILYNLADTKKYLSFERLLLGWLERNQKPALPILETFPSAIYVLKEHKILRNSILTQLFNNDSSSFHVYARKIVSDLWVHKIYDVEFDDGIIKEMSDVDLIFVTRKVLGHIYQAQPLCSLFFSVVKACPSNKKNLSLVKEVFVNEISEDYPESTKAFLKDQIKSVSSVQAKNFIETVLSDIEKRQNQLSSLRYAKELAPSKPRERQLLRAMAKQHQKAEKQAFKGSILQDLSTQTPLKAGKGWFSRIDGQYREPSPLQSLSISTEMPRSQIKGKVCADYKKSQFILCKRGDF